MEYISNSKVLLYSSLHAVNCRPQRCRKPNNEKLIWKKSVYLWEADVYVLSLYSGYVVFTTDNVCVLHPIFAHKSALRSLQWAFYYQEMQANAVKYKSQYFQHASKTWQLMKSNVNKNYFEAWLNNWLYYVIQDISGFLSKVHFKEVRGNEGRQRRTARNHDFILLYSYFPPSSCPNMADMPHLSYNTVPNHCQGDSIT